MQVYAQSIEESRKNEGVKKEDAGPQYPEQVRFM
jgi:hypothetical protein